MALEIEKRLLLKNVPDIQFDEIQLIIQFYGKNGRYRHVLSYPGNVEGNPLLTVSTYQKFLHTVKKHVSKGVAKEIEVEITSAAFEKAVAKCTKTIRKIRKIKKVGKYKWEIDIFDFKLIAAEIEVKTKKELKTVHIPKYIKAQLIADITGDKRFSNFNLADKLIAKKGYNIFNWLTDLSL